MKDYFMKKTLTKKQYNSKTFTDSLKIPTVRENLEFLLSETNEIIRASQNSFLVKFKVVLPPLIIV